jgi:hypothetical protein
MVATQWLLSSQGHKSRTSFAGTRSENSSLRPGLGHQTINNSQQMIFLTKQIYLILDWTGLELYRGSRG